MNYSVLKRVLVFAVTSAAIFVAPQKVHSDEVQAGPEAQEAQPFEFPTSENDATFRFTSFPDLFNWNIKYPQSGWEEAVDWFLIGMKREGPAFSLNAGDIMDARWWSSKEEVRRQTNEYWGGFRRRFEDKNIDLWKTMVKYGVDVYFCGEHHRITAKQHDGIWQVVHGALWGTQPDLNYLRGSVWPNRLELELFRIDVEYGGKLLTEQHPHRGNGGPWSNVKISESTKKNGPVSVGKLVIEAGSDGNRTSMATGEFAKAQR